MAHHERTNVFFLSLLRYQKIHHPVFQQMGVFLSDTALKSKRSKIVCTINMANGDMFKIKAPGRESANGALSYYSISLPFERGAAKGGPIKNKGKCFHFSPQPCKINIEVQRPFHMNGKNAVNARAKEEQTYAVFKRRRNQIGSNLG